MYIFLKRNIKLVQDGAVLILRNGFWSFEFRPWGIFVSVSSAVVIYNWITQLSLKKCLTEAVDETCTAEDKAEIKSV